MPFTPDARAAAPQPCTGGQELPPLTRLVLAVNAVVLGGGRDPADRARLGDRLAALAGVEPPAPSAALLRDVARLWLEREAPLELLASALLEHTRVVLARQPRAAGAPSGHTGGRRIDAATHAARVALAHENLEEGDTR
jgi:hypothetical protein